MILARRLYLIFGLLLSATYAFGQATVSRVGDLPSGIEESSGLLLVNGRLLTHNDSGNEAVLYELDTTSLGIARSIRITNAQNTDWEDLAMDNMYIYVGDIGNNLGQRQDLKIWRISLEEALNAETVTAEAIAYTYEDQSDFSGGQNSDWDAEALVVRGDSLWIFTKQWQSQGTVIYRIPKTPGSHTAERIAELAVGGLVTSASPFSDNTGIALLGYSGQLQPFFLSLPLQPGEVPSLVNANPEQLDMGFAQAEGITALDQDTYFFTSEAFSNPLLNLPASLFRLELPDSGEGEPGEGEGGPGEGEPGEGEPGEGEGEPGESENPLRGGGPTPGLNPDELRIFRPQGSSILEYAHGSSATVLGRAIFDVSGRRILFQQGTSVQNPSIDISQLEQAVYYLTLYLRDLTLTEPFVSK